MLRLRKIIDAVGTGTHLGKLVTRARREAERADADPFDEAMIAAVLGTAEAMKADADALAELETGAAKTARRAMTAE